MKTFLLVIVVLFSNLVYAANDKVPEPKYTSLVPAFMVSHKAAGTNVVCIIPSKEVPLGLCFEFTTQIAKPCLLIGFPEMIDCDIDVVTETVKKHNKSSKDETSL